MFYRLGDDGRATVLSGDWDGRLCVWRVGVGGEGESERMDEDPVVKKRRGANSASSGAGTGATSVAALATLAPAAAWKAHAHCVGAVAWMDATSSESQLSERSSESSSGGVCASAVTASWDHSIKTWDVERQVRGP